MSAEVLTAEAVREERTPPRVAFERLLEWLDNGDASHGRTYLEMRLRLVAYFERRNRPTADDLADETLNRIARTLESDCAIAITPPARYCYIVARFVFLEDVRREHADLRIRHLKLAGAEMAIPRAWTGEPEASLRIREQRLECLERCLQQLTPDRRALVIQYHRDAGRQKIAGRRDLAQRLGITANALSIRVSRIRAALEVSVESCRRERQATQMT